MIIEIIKTDITEMQVDAIVNVANPSLIRSGGLCGAIFKKAGFELDNECNKIGHCNTGEAVITKGYALKAKYIKLQYGTSLETRKIGKNCSKIVIIIYSK